MDEIIAMVVIGIPLVTIILGIVRGPRWYWVAGMSTYMLAAMSVAGMLIVSLSFVLFTLAFGHTVSLVSAPLHSLGMIMVGLAAWALVVRTLDDYWVFLPISWFIP